MSTIMIAQDGQPRCQWCSTAPEFISYHDEEWGFPVDDDVRLFEKLCLESFQSGLSWRTILAKRENFRAAFHHFIDQQLHQIQRRKLPSALPPFVGQQNVIHAADAGGFVVEASGNAGSENGGQAGGRIRGNGEFPLPDIELIVRFLECGGGGHARPPRRLRRGCVRIDCPGRADMCASRRLRELLP